MKYTTLSSRALKLMSTTAVIKYFILLAAAGFAAFKLYNAGFVRSAIAVIAAAALIACAGIAVIPRIRFRRYRYLIQADRIEIVEGIFFVSRTIIPIDRIHQIDIQKGPLDNAFKVAKVVVTTAGSNAAFRFLEPERADEIAEYLNATIAKKLAAREVSDV